MINFIFFYFLVFIYSNDEKSVKKQNLHNIKDKNLRKKAIEAKLTKPFVPGGEKKENDEKKINPTAAKIERKNATINIPKFDLSTANTRNQALPRKTAMPNIPKVENNTQMDKISPKNAAHDNNDRGKNVNSKPQEKEEVEQNEINNEFENENKETQNNNEQNDNEKEQHDIYEEKNENNNDQNDNEKVQNENNNEQNDNEKEQNENNNDHELVEVNKDPETPLVKYAKFHIVSINPEILNSRGDEKVEIKMNTTLDGPPFIKFGDKIVTGKHSKKHLTIKCRSPKMVPGDIPIYISIDKVKWSRPFYALVEKTSDEIPWIFILCAGISVITVSYIIIKLICGRRAVPKRRKANRRIVDDPFNIIIPSIRSSAPHKRTKYAFDL